MPMVEEAFMECHSPERAAKLALMPIEYPAELKMKDRQDLDLAVFEMLGVTDSLERERLCDELYYETAKHLRQVRIVEIRKQEQRAGRDGSTFSVNDFALDLWDALTDDERLPLENGWANNRPEDGRSLFPRLDRLCRQVTTCWTAQTVFFQPRERNAKATAVSCPSRAHAELLYAIANSRLAGEFNLRIRGRSVRTITTVSRAARIGHYAQTNLHEAERAMRTKPETSQACFGSGCCMANHNPLIPAGPVAPVPAQELQPVAKQVVNPAPGEMID